LLDASRLVKQLYLGTRHKGATRIGHQAADSASAGLGKCHGSSEKRSDPYTSQTAERPDAIILEFQVWAPLKAKNALPGNMFRLQRTDEKL
jgi:hypothetical protein